MAAPGIARMHAAAMIIAVEAARLASAWSFQIPPSIQVYATPATAKIRSAVGPSYPNEVIRVRHPVFETPERLRTPWVTNEYRPFLAPAAIAKAGAAAAEIAEFIDDYCVSLGFRKAR